jgi:hypothetical protein
MSFSTRVCNFRSALAEGIRVFPCFQNLLIKKGIVSHLHQSTESSQRLAALEVRCCSRTGFDGARRLTWDHRELN